jgi:hypothetical protein
MLARQLQLREGFDMDALMNLVTRCDKRALCERLGHQLAWVWGLPLRLCAFAFWLLVRSAEHG